MTLTKAVRLLLISGVVATLVYLVSQIGSSDREYAVALQQERHEKDRSFSQSSASPLPEQKRGEFEGLEYFEPGKEYRVRTAIQKLERPEPYTMQLTGNTTADYLKYGWVEFELEGKQHRLYLYQRPAGTNDRSFFVPFTDLTNGHDTYGGGRYLDVVPVSAGEVELDFNRAYNPYCAYNHDYSCPIPPKENHLNAHIRAGEKAPY